MVSFDEEKANPTIMDQKKKSGKSAQGRSCQQGF